MTSPAKPLAPPRGEALGPHQHAARRLPTARRMRVTSSAPAALERDRRPARSTVPWKMLLSPTKSATKSLAGRS